MDRGDSPGPKTPSPPTTFRCRLSPGTRVEWRDGRCLVVRERPLAVVELREAGARLLEAVRQGRTLVPSQAERALLHRLEALGLAELRPVPRSWPRVTVVVPVRDRPAQLAACLASLRRLRYPPDRLEVVVVDDGSRSPLPPLGQARLVRLPVPRGPAAARNAGAREARGEVLAFVDSDCQAEEGWLEELITELARSGVAAAGGRVAASRERGWLERYEAVRSPLDLGAQPASVLPRGRVPYLVAACLAVRRADFETVGGFDERLRHGEDVDLCWRLASRGRRIVYQPLAVVRHDHRGRLRDFVLTRARYAASEAALLRRHPGGHRWLSLSPGAAAAVVGMLAALLGRPRPAALGGLALAAETAVAVRQLEDLGISPRRGLGALAAGQAAGLYHLCRQLCRYYGLPALSLALLAGRARRRRLLLGLGAAALVPALADWYRLRPSLSPPAFAAASLLDDLAYQSGLWLGCLRERTIAPLLTELRLIPGRGR
ncbi:MAG TPA: mycofactocin biosynthesis glycosyltransferase MftF [Candidatus Dormibacteraeota bacterium]|nr:mycofactocin biosynthesis glycosyltransferase MftF [Candidatus Dormibacteraeota bacterium]